MPAPLSRRLAVLASLLIGSAAPAETSLLDDPSRGFDRVEAPFEQRPSLASVTLRTPDGSKGVAEFQLGGADLSRHAGDRLVIDYLVGERHEAAGFVIELVDAAGEIGRWRFSTAGAAPGTPETGVARSTLGQAGIDLGEVAAWRLIGDPDDRAPLELSIGSVRVTGDAAAPPAYDGREPDARWRRRAADWIERHRLTDLTVRVVDLGDGPMPAARVVVRRRRSPLLSGEAIPAAATLDADDPRLSETLAETRRERPEAPLVIVEPEGMSRAELIERLRRIKGEGKRVDGVAIRLGGDEQNLIGPERLWGEFDRLEGLASKVYLIGPLPEIGDEALREDYARDLATALLAHPKSGGVLPGGAARTGATLDLAAVPPSGEERVELDELARARLRPRVGRVEVEARFGEHHVAAEAELSPLAPAEVELRLPLLLGDFNGDGKVDAADVSVWGDARGSTADPPGSGADANADGKVDREDHAIWRANYGRKAG